MGVNKYSKGEGSLYGFSPVIFVNGVLCINIHSFLYLSNHLDERQIKRGISGGDEVCIL